MAAKPTIAIVGPGRLGNALARSLHRAGYSIREVISRANPDSQRRAKKLAKAVGARAASPFNAELDAQFVWFCVPDREIATAARALAPRTSWNKKTAIHVSGALTSDELQVLKRRGASVASVHPLMTFVRSSIPALDGVYFGMEGDPAALRLARQVVRSLHGESFSVAKSKKSAYHAWGGFTSPLLVALLVSGEQVARLAGLSAAEARKRMARIVAQTLANYISLGPAGAFSGPMVRGDAAVVGKHLRVLKKIPVARDVYVALARAAVELLPTRNRDELRKILRRG